MSQEILNVAIDGAAQTNIFGATGGLGGCYEMASNLLPVLTAMPTANASLSSYLATQTQTATLTNACEIPLVTGSMGDEYTSYVSSLSSWASKHKTDVSNLLSACSNVPEISSALKDYPNITSACSSYKWGTKSHTKTKSRSATAKLTATDSETTGTATAEASTSEATTAEATSTEAAASTSETDAASLGSNSEVMAESSSSRVRGSPQLSSMALAVIGLAGLAITGMY